MYKRGDLIVEVRVPAGGPDFAAAFEKTGRTRVDVALVNCAAAVAASGGVIEKARIAINGISAAPHIAGSAGDYLAGKPCSEEAFVEAGRLVAEGVSPRDDHRASGEDRRKAAGVLAARALSRAVEAV